MSTLPLWELLSSTYYLKYIGIGTNHVEDVSMVSFNGCPMEQIFEFVDYLLQLGVKKITSYIQDTTHLLRILQDMGTLPE